jgi:hypothetical protein
LVKKKERNENISKVALKTFRLHLVVLSLPTLYKETSFR